MKISDLISRIGDENVEIENLDTSFDRAKAKPGETTITFKTKQPMSSKGTEKVGMIVWMDRDEVQKAVGEYLEENPL
ncbi:hypothetical protein [Sulfitobacter sp. R18_1]|uniref:hypothetical protein n=1 Tax=Sulfitobacter sp. R18_1 TaxID=2821104 RepID=UPI001ADAA421|nr:hypothetical protein [Sulfitobacter sp. R18_1]MBO9428234.1 hypothetical protein [Sulfitobacter sp. R18_1]